MHVIGGTSVDDASSSTNRLKRGKGTSFMSWSQWRMGSGRASPKSTPRAWRYRRPSTR
ncbi:hypothetical protein RHMOL_Rhmol07G0260500 [Rhododendron molle]|uniref:Uncharacterized protein n=1 Tax=Rhododendron molle TaxID=49168 RepID=A0ACC0N6A8_RHOML|nr:hypothetical protein RHMOL_Rhmol07G0260500 [Rhododendron molle]